VKSLHERKIKDGARPFLEDGEEVLAAFVARPRGWTQAMAGSLHLGSAQQGRAHAGAEQAGFRLASPMALAVTQRRLLALRIGSPIGLGIGGKVKELVSAAPIADVETVDVRRRGLGQVITLVVRSASFELEANAMAGAKDLAEALAHPDDRGTDDVHVRDLGAP
jgi:hypothetical protein